MNSTILAIKNKLVEKSPELLLGLGLAGMLTSAVLAVKATPKALALIDEAKEKHGTDLTVKETVTVAWKPYVLPAVTFVVSAFGIIMSHRIDIRRNAALAAAYVLSDTALKEYTSKTIDILGKEADEEVKTAIAKDKVENAETQTPTKTTIITTPEKCRCIDSISGRQWFCSLDILRRAECEINNRLRHEDYISLNEFYYEVGLDPIHPVGDDLGWNVNREYMKIDPTAVLDNNGNPCLVVNYTSSPRPGFNMDYYNFA